jgi:tetratricopeptide (TPR) repeat protein
MGDLWIQVVPRTNDERERLRADFGPKVMTEDAIGYEKMLETDPRNPRLHNAAGTIALALGTPDRAVAHFEQSLRIESQSAETHYNLATALVRQGRAAEAMPHFRRALEIDPDHAAAHVNLGVVLRSQNRIDEAATEFHQALRIDPANAAAHTNLAGTLAARNQLGPAVAEYRTAIQSNPDLLEALTDLAWILATARDAAYRAPAEAVRLAERAVTLTGQQSVRALETVAAAYAATGNFEKAIAAQQRAIDLAETAGTKSAVVVLRERIDLYRRGVAYIDH